MDKELPAPESIGAGKEIVEKMNGRETKELHSLIKSGALVSEAILQKMVEYSVPEALAAGRIFALSGSDGGKFFPAWLGNPDYPPDAVASLVQAMPGLSASAKHDVFVHKSHHLQCTVLEAIKAGRLTEALSVVTGHNERYGSVLDTNGVSAASPERGRGASSDEW